MQQVAVHFGKVNAQAERLNRCLIRGDFERFPKDVIFVGQFHGLAIAIKNGHNYGYFNAMCCENDGGQAVNFQGSDTVQHAIFGVV